MTNTITKEQMKLIDDYISTDSADNLECGIALQALEALEVLSDIGRRLASGEWVMVPKPKYMGLKGGEMSLHFSKEQQEDATLKAISSLYCCGTAAVEK